MWDLGCLGLGLRGGEEEWSRSYYELGDLWIYDFEGLSLGGLLIER